MKHKVVKVSITTMDGELLDQFAVYHWKADTWPGQKPNTDLDEENVGSHASNSLLAERIERYIEP